MATSSSLSLNISPKHSSQWQQPINQSWVILQKKWLKKMCILFIEVNPFHFIFLFLWEQEERLWRNLCHLIHGEREWFNMWPYIMKTWVCALRLFLSEALARRTGGWADCMARAAFHSHSLILAPSHWSLLLHLLSGFSDTLCESSHIQFANVWLFIALRTHCCTQLPYFTVL